MKPKIFFAFLALSAVFTSRASFAASPYTQLWSVQFGSTQSDYATSIAQSPAGDYYVAGGTRGSYAAQNAGNDDSFLQQISSQGQPGWRKQVGTSNSERYQSVATANASIYWLTGMEGAAQSGLPGIYRYDHTGALQSTSISGFPDYQPSVDTSSIATDSFGNVYVVGPVVQDFSSINSYIAKIDSSDSTQWSRLTNSSPQNFDKIQAAIDKDGFVYFSQSILIQNQADLQLRKYTPQGQLLWSRTYGSTAYELVEGLAIDAAGNPVLAGLSQGDFGGSQAGDGDAFAAKFNPNGDLLWATQFGDAASQTATSVAIAPNGHVFVGGVDWTVPDQINGLNQRGMWAELGPAGNLLWTSTFTTGRNQSVLELLVDINGDLVLVGQTNLGTFGQSQGGLDAFVVKFDVNAVPEPSALFATAAAAVVILTLNSPRLRSSHSAVHQRHLERL